MTPTNPTTMPTTTAESRTARLERMISKLTRAYRRRKAEGRRVGHLLIRVRTLSASYLAAREESLQS